MSPRCLILVTLAASLSCAYAQSPQTPPSSPSAPAPPIPSRQPHEPREFLPTPFDKYFARRVAELSRPDWQNDITPENWSARRAKMRQQLLRMLGLDPWPARGNLMPVVTGVVAGDGYIVEKLQFQSSPGLYVTANFYRPGEVPQPLPAILYVCGHSSVVENGVSMGSKTGYQHHGVWFGEIRGEHHGTYSKGRWWWPSRGYTPAGVEAWNGIRALDYLDTRPEVDHDRMAVTGRSGGGAYSWWIAALDDRIKVAVPTAGITDLKNHILDGAIEGHCDCMFMVNEERWDFDRVAALVAPRPLLIANTDADGIFPLDGVMDIYNRTRALYRKLGKESNIGIHIAEGPHMDTQALNFGAFAWLNRFLKGADRMALIDEPARKALPPHDLKVFTELPKDEKVTAVDEYFVPKFTPPPEVKSAAEWAILRDGWMKALREDCFRAWPSAPTEPSNQPAIVSGTAEGVRLTTTNFTSEDPFQSDLWILHREDVKSEEISLVVLNVLDDESWKEFYALAAAGFPARFPAASPDAAGFAEMRGLLLGTKWAMAYVCPRGVGPDGWTQLTANKQTQLRRRLLLLGESLESGQVWDICQAAAALRNVPGFGKTQLWLQSQRTMAANTLYASLFIPDVHRLDLHAMPASHREGPTYLNVLRHLDLPQAAALAAERSTLALYTDNPAPWRFAQSVATALSWGEKRVQIRNPLDATPAAH
jgi:hypothetical protein